MNVILVILQKFSDIFCFWIERHGRKLCIQQVSSALHKIISDSYLKRSELIIFSHLDYCAWIFKMTSSVSLALSLLLSLYFCMGILHCSYMPNNSYDIVGIIMPTKTHVIRRISYWCETINQSSLKKTSQPWLQGNDKAKRTVYKSQKTH